MTACILMFAIALSLIYITPNETDEIIRESKTQDDHISYTIDLKNYIFDEFNVKYVTAHQALVKRLHDHFSEVDTIYTGFYNPNEYKIITELPSKLLLNPIVPVTQIQPWNENNNIISSSFEMKSINKAWGIFIVQNLIIIVEVRIIDNINTNQNKDFTI